MKPLDFLIKGFEYGLMAGGTVVAFAAVLLVAFAIVGLLAGIIRLTVGYEDEDEDVEESDEDKDNTD